MSPDGRSSSSVWKRFRADQRAAASATCRAGCIPRRRRDEPAGAGCCGTIDFAVEPGESVGLVGAQRLGQVDAAEDPRRGHVPLRRQGRRRRPHRGADRGAGRHPPGAHRPREHLPHGTLLGLPASRSADRFDEIVEFAELEDAIDRQVKFYSSGMQMRLGFGVAAFLEPDVLLVDEVLAVGDASFQQRCLDRMREVLSRHDARVRLPRPRRGRDDVPERCGCTTASWRARDHARSARRVSPVGGGGRPGDEHFAGGVAVPKAVMRSADGGPFPQSQGPLEV